MRIFLAVLLTIAGIGHSLAADAWSRASSKDAPASIEVGNTNVNPFGGIYIGAELGGQFTSIAISGLGFDELADGASADGLVYGARGGINLPFGRFVAGPYVKGGFADVAFTLFDRDVLSMDNYLQTGGLIGVQIGDSSLVSVRLGYEWQEWTADFGGGDSDVSASGWVLGGDIETLLSKETSIGLHVDYVQLSDIEADGVGDLSKFLGDTEALRVTLGLTYRPQIGLPSLESLRR